MTRPTPVAVTDSRPHRAASLSAVAAAVIGTVALATLLAAPYIPGSSPFGMKANAAVAIIGIAAALLTVERNVVFSRLMAGAAFALTSLTLLEHVAGLQLGIDELLVRDRTGGVAPGRMAWETAAALTAVAIGTLLAGSGRLAMARRAGQVLATLVSAAALFVVLAYLFGASAFRNPALATRMAPETALAILLLSIAVLLRHAAAAWPRLLFADSPAGRLVRRFLPAAIVVTLAIGWLRAFAESRGIDYKTGIALSVTANAVILMALVLWWGQRTESDHQQLKERDEALSASDERFRLAAMATNDAIYDWDMIAGVRSWNSVMSDRYGYPLVDSGRVGEAWLQRVHPDDRERVGRGWNEALAGGDRVWRCEYRSFRGDGTVEDLLERTFIVRDGGGTAVRAIGAITELTTLKHAEAILRDANTELERRVAERTAELAESNRQLLAEISQREAMEQEIRRQRDFTETLFEATGAVFIVIDRELKIVRLNRAGQRSTGYSMDELRGRSVLDTLIPPENREALAEVGARMLAGDVGDQILIEWMTRSGERRTMSWMTSPLYADDGSVEYLLGAGVDVTAEHAAQAGLRQQSERLAAMNAELEAFSYSVSHDLRAPLRSIDGFSQALLEDNDAQLDDAGRSHLRRIRNATQKMAELIDGLLELSRVSRASLQRARVDVSALALQTIERLREQDPSRAVDVAIQPAIIVEGDSRLLRIVIENLLENAWKFTSKTEAPRIEVGAGERDGLTEIFVRDNGAGFDPQYASKLFGAFQRLHSSSEFPGTGIGLATVQRIIARHGGVLHAQGAPGRGATFSFTMEGHSS